MEDKIDKGLGQFRGVRLNVDRTHAAVRGVRARLNNGMWCVCYVSLEHSAL